MTFFPKYNLLLLLQQVGFLYFLSTQISCTSSGQSNEDSTGFTISTNEHFIQDLYSHVDIKDPKAVFHQVFNNLQDSVVIYPSEGFYYFKFNTGGQLFIGSFAFLSDSRDKGVVYFGYSQKIDRNRQQDYTAPGGSLDLSLESDVAIDQIGPFRHRMTYNDKDVVFTLYKPELSPPRKAKLIPSEKFVGPSFDESGIQFYLLYDTLTRNFLWILNEDVYIPEKFEKISSEVVIGLRTGFAFYRDTVNSRNILIGALGWNVFQNNWYDGPFDHLPDNYVYSGQIDLKSFIEKSNLVIEGNIDKYGNYLDDPGSRVAISPYKIYYFDDEFNYINECEKYGNTAEFYSCLTQ